MPQKLNICCYSNQVKKLFYRMNGVRILTVMVSAKRATTVVVVVVESPQAPEDDSQKR